MRSNEACVLKVPKFKHDISCVFAVCGPLAWNCLLKKVMLCDETGAFKQTLKTHLFIKFVNKSILANLFEELLQSTLECYPHSLWHYLNIVNLNLYIF